MAFETSTSWSAGMLHRLGVGNMLRPPEGDTTLDDWWGRFSSQLTDRAGLLLVRLEKSKTLPHRRVVFLFCFFNLQPLSPLLLPLHSFSHFCVVVTRLWCCKNLLRWMFASLALHVVEVRDALMRNWGGGTIWLCLLNDCQYTPI